MRERIDTVFESVTRLKKEITDTVKLVIEDNIEGCFPGMAKEILEEPISKLYNEFGQSLEILGSDPDWNLNANTFFLEILGYVLGTDRFSFFSRIDKKINFMVQRSLIVRLDNKIIKVQLDDSHNIFLIPEAIECLYCPLESFLVKNPSYRKKICTELEKILEDNFWASSLNETAKFSIQRMILLFSETFKPEYQAYGYIEKLLESDLENFIKFVGSIISPSTAKDFLMIDIVVNHIASLIRKDKISRNTVSEIRYIFKSISEYENYLGEFLKVDFSLILLIVQEEEGLYVENIPIFLEENRDFICSKLTPDLFKEILEAGGAAYFFQWEELIPIISNTITNKEELREFLNQFCAFPDGLKLLKDLKKFDLIESMEDIEFILDGLSASYREKILSVILEKFRVKRVEDLISIVTQLELDQRYACLLRMTDSNQLDLNFSSSLMQSAEQLKDFLNIFADMDRLDFLKKYFNLACCLSDIKYIAVILSSLPVLEYESFFDLLNVNDEWKRNLLSDWCFLNEIVCSLKVKQIKGFFDLKWVRDKFPDLIITQSYHEEISCRLEKNVYDKFLELIVERNLSQFQAKIKNRNIGEFLLEKIPDERRLIFIKYFSQVFQLTNASFYKILEWLPEADHEALLSLESIEDFFDSISNQDSFSFLSYAFEENFSESKRAYVFKLLDIKNNLWKWFRYDTPILSLILKNETFYEKFFALPEMKAVVKKLFIEGILPETPMEPPVLTTFLRVQENKSRLFFIFRNQAYINNAACFACVLSTIPIKDYDLFIQKFCAKNSLAQIIKNTSDLKIILDALFDTQQNTFLDLLQVKQFLKEFINAANERRRASLLSIIPKKHSQLLIEMPEFKSTLTKLDHLLLDFHSAIEKKSYSDAVVKLEVLATEISENSDAPVSENMLKVRLRSPLFLHPRYMAIKNAVANDVRFTAALEFYEKFYHCPKNKSADNIAVNPAYAKLKNLINQLEKKAILLAEKNPEKAGAISMLVKKFRAESNGYFLDPSNVNAKLLLSRCEAQVAQYKENIDMSLSSPEGRLMKQILLALSHLFVVTIPFIWGSSTLRCTFFGKTETRELVDDVLAEMSKSADKKL